MEKKEVVESKNQNHRNKKFKPELIIISGKPRLFWV